MGNGRQAAISVARVVSAALLAMVIVGPAPYGYLMWVFGTYESLFLMVLYLALCGLVAGIFAGRSLAAKSGGLCVLWANHGLLLEMPAGFRGASVDGLWVELLAMTAIALGFLGLCMVVSGLCAKWASKKLSIDHRGGYGAAWIAVSLVGVCLFAYAYAQGMETATRALKPEAERVALKAHGPHIDTRVTSIFPTVTVEPCEVEPGELSFGFASYMYYTDPTAG